MKTTILGIALTAVMLTACSTADTADQQTDIDTTTVIASDIEDSLTSDGYSASAIDSINAAGDSTVEASAR